jgi:hypothetical protein
MVSYTNRPGIILLINIYIYHPIEYAPLKPKKRDTKENMAEAIFMAKKKRTARGEEEEEDGEETNENVGQENEFQQDDYQGQRTALSSGGGGRGGAGRQLVPQHADDEYDPAL